MHIEIETVTDPNSLSPLPNAGLFIDELRDSCIDPIT
jgi:hypothetical protein